MKNYTYGWHLRNQGYVEVPESEYTERMIDMKNFIDKLSDVVKEAKCGWSKVEYKVMKYMDDSFEKFNQNLSYPERRYNSAEKYQP